MLSRVSSAVLTALFSVLFLSEALAVAITVQPFEHAGRSAWDEVIEAESAAVTKSGSFANFNFGPEPWNNGVWLVVAGSYIEASFSVAADTLIVQFEADGNDGLAEFIVDGLSVGTYDTYRPSGEWFGVAISGLSYSAHTLRVLAAGNHPGFIATDDLAIDVLGAVVTSREIPEPATLAIFGTGLLFWGLAGLGLRRRRKAN